ncbi:carbohydrate ABC transporter permease [Microbacterium sp.]|uniref:carbohydrate ABC transporter permease n=1 Tax=Microbacterium sp. TaxID=51671 RepID=UPI003F727506
MRKNTAARGLLWFAICTSIAALFLFPLYAVVTAAFKSPAELNGSPPTLIPRSFTLENFAALQGLGNGVWVHIGNSAILAVITVVGTVIIATLGGWGFARYRFPGRGVVFVAMLSALMVPFQPLLTPLFLVLKSLGLGNTLFGLALVFITFQLPFALFVMRNAFMHVPQALEDAARVDGASGWKLLTQVLLPVVRPGIITVALFAFLSSWNEFLAALILLSDQSLFPLPVALSAGAVNGNNGVRWPLLEAGVLITMIPCLVLFFTLQRYYTTGLVAGAVKE